jgi:hypothetical protein
MSAWWWTAEQVQQEGAGRSPETAVEAAAKALAARNGYPNEWQFYLSDVKTALEAAAPHLMARAWAEGHEDGFWNGRLSHGDPEALTGVEHAEASNPYRAHE